MAMLSAHSRPPAKVGPMIHSDQKMLAVLRHLALGEHTLGRRTFIQRRRDTDPSAALYERRFGSWYRALEEADLDACEQPLQLQGSTTKWTEPELVKAVAQYMTETGSATLFGYEDWRNSIAGTQDTQNTPSAEHGAEIPTASTIRFRLVTWSRAIRLAHRLNQHQHQHQQQH